MKKIIGRLTYNTETAEEIHSWSNSYSSSDFHSCSEALFRTGNGRYFLYGHGGPMSKYATQCDSNSWSGGSNIIPLTDEEALDWLVERGAEEETVLAHFPTALSPA